jgi:hypothetical protein
MFRVPVLFPRTVGEKLTLMVQFAPPASDVPQLLVCAKFPVTVIAPMLAAAVPLLVSVAVWATLFVPIN